MMSKDTDMTDEELTKLAADAELPAPWIGYCDNCNAPIASYNWLQRLFHRACFHLMLAWPDRWMPWPILPYAGNHAFTCTCSKSELRTSTSAQSGDSQC